MSCTFCLWSRAKVAHVGFDKACAVSITQHPRQTSDYHPLIPPTSSPTSKPNTNSSSFTHQAPRHIQTTTARMDIIVILGATGQQGSSVVDAFLQNGNWKVRGVTRNVESEAAKKLAAKVCIELLDSRIGISVIDVYRVSKLSQLMLMTNVRSWKHLR